MKRIILSTLALVITFLLGMACQWGWERMGRAERIRKGEKAAKMLALYGYLGGQKGTEVNKVVDGAVTNRARK